MSCIVTTLRARVRPMSAGSSLLRPWKISTPLRRMARPLRRHDSGIVRHLEPAAVALPRSKQGIAIIRSVFGQQPHRTPRIVSQTASIKEKPLRIEPDIHDIPLFDERFRARKDKTIYRKTAIQPPFFRNWHPSRLRRRPVSDRCRRAARIPVSHRERQRAAAPLPTAFRQKDAEV